MKVTDLMIGDWVQNETGTIVGRVVNLDVYGARVQFAGYTIDADYVYPVQLTPEIVEKNGFRGDVYSCVLKFEACGDEFLFKIRHYLEPDGHTDYTFYGFGGEYNIHYVHELQHAMKLCGLNNEINLGETWNGRLV